MQGVLVLTPMISTKRLRYYNKILITILNNLLLLLRTYKIILKFKANG